jgi:hypothetical protein
MSTALDLARNISTTFILAGIEELIKAYLVVLFRDTRFRIPSYFLFFWSGVRFQDAGDL